jgi:hypothetical protein
MNTAIDIIDGRLTQLGPSTTNENGITEYDYIKLEQADGSDRFLPKNRSPGKMASYLSEGLGKEARLFVVEVPTTLTEYEAVVLGIELETGKRFSLASEVDAQMRHFKNMLFLFNALIFCMIGLGISLIFTVIGALFSLGCFYVSWKLIKARRGMQRSLNVMPTGAELSQFMKRNTKDFTQQRKMAT